MGESVLPSRLAVIGATGSVGGAVVDICRRFPERFRITAMAGLRNVAGMARLAAEFNPETVAMVDERSAAELQSIVPGGVRVLSGGRSIRDIALGSKASQVVFASSGTEAIPARAEFVDFPVALGEWTGRRETLDLDVLAELEPTDYVIADFQTPSGEWVDFYSAYYESQRAQASAHSPRSCIPGGGWLIADLSERELPGVSVNGQPLVVNRVEIAKGDFRQVVYYWFQQRGRVMTNEYLVKWYLLWDAVTRRRTDGAMVRLTTQVRPGEAPEKADERLAAFAREVVPRLEAFVPN